MPLTEKIEKYLTEQITYPEEKVPGVVIKKFKELENKMPTGASIKSIEEYYRKNWREGMDVIALIDRLIKHLGKI